MRRKQLMPVLMGALLSASFSTAFAATSPTDYVKVNTTAQATTAASGKDAIAIGQGATSNGVESLVIGSGKTTGKGNIVIGNGSQTYDATTSALVPATLSGNDAIFMGRDNLGFNAVYNSVLIGKANRMAPEPYRHFINATVVGYNNNVSSSAVIYGNGSSAGYDSFVVGDSSMGYGQRATAIGTGTKAIGTDAISIGFSSHANGTNTMNFGAYGSVDGLESLGIGYNTTVTGNTTVALGAHSVASRASKVVGYQPYALVVEGNSADNSNIRSTYLYKGLEDSSAADTAGTEAYKNDLKTYYDAIQKHVDAFKKLSDAFKAYGSAVGTAKEADAKTAYEAAKAEEASTDKAWRAIYATLGKDDQAAAFDLYAKWKISLHPFVSSAGEVSVGQLGYERQITHVAAGSEDTDAVNVAQLKANLRTAMALNPVQYVSATNEPLVLGQDGQYYKATDMNPDGSFKDLNSPAAPVAKASLKAAVKSGDGSVTTPTTLTNIKAGEAPTDAVNVSQLQAAIANGTGVLMPKIQELSNRVDASGAMGAALAALKPLPFDAYSKYQVMAGIGNYVGNRSLALGVAYHKNDNFMVTGGMAFASGHLMTNLGVSLRVGHSDMDMRHVSDFTTQQNLAYRVRALGL